MARRKLSRQVYQENKKKRKLILLFKIGGVGFVLSILFIFLLFVFYAKDLPRPEKFTERQIVQSTKIYDRSGSVLLYEIYGEEKRTVVPLEKIPEHLKQAVILTEDANFYQHFGIDIEGIVRAALVNLKIRKPTYGGSTIPQQLIRSAFLTLKKTPERKVREIILALELDRRYSKEQILGWYLNQVPFGQNTYGVEAASQTYFQKSVSGLTLAEAATLAALIKAPTSLSPYGERKEELLKRKDQILDRMATAGLVSLEEKELAKKEELKFAEILMPIKAPHFSLWVKEYLTAKYGENFLKEQGLKVYTSLDWPLQELAEKVVSEGAKRNRNYRAFNASLVAINPKTGEILAMVGSADWFANSYPENCSPGKNCLFEPKFNMTVGTKKSPGRQPGSAFKPFVYATAFKKGYSDKEVVVDEETNFGTLQNPYTPQNYDGLFRGPVTLRQALAQSLNIPSIKVLKNFAGLEESIRTAKDFGITTLTKSASFYGLPLVLGGGEVKLLDMVSAYGVFGQEGLRVEPISILKIENSQGNVIEENKNSPKRVLGIEAARLINDILADNEARAPIFGLRSPLHLENYQVAAKTGTTQNFRDGWIIGYTPSLSAGVWVGNNDNTPMQKEPGVVVAGPIWKAFMEKALLAFPREIFAKPEELFSSP